MDWLLDSSNIGALITNTIVRVPCYNNIYIYNGPRNPILFIKAPPILFGFGGCRCLGCCCCGGCSTLDSASAAPAPAPAPAPAAATAASTSATSAASSAIGTPTPCPPTSRTALLESSELLELPEF